ncbi:MAG: hypothetical protein AB8G23_19055 [Myxococcota bacterium]
MNALLIRRTFGILLVLSLGLALTSRTVKAGSLVDEWETGLRGALLTSYSGSIISSNSSLTTLRLCRSGRFRLEREGSWSAGDAAMGASQSVLTGTWDVVAQGLSIVVTYVTDSGQSGGYPVYLQNNGRVNLGGTSYAAQRGGAGC